MQVYTQKYTIVHSLQTLDKGFEYTMDHWPLHMTLADVFAIDGEPVEVLNRLSEELRGHTTVSSKVIEDAWFGPHRDTHVMLLDRTAELQQLHEQVIRVLGEFDVVFNSPQYIGDGFKPHSTVQSAGSLQPGDTIIINSITLIDMFPNQDHRQRRVLGTITF